MGESGSTSAVGAVVSDRDVLLATKLYVPRQQPGFVRRARLVAALDEGLSRQVVLVCAPAGSGKTTLLANWARSGGRAVAWLSVDAGDNDPLRFWRHVVAAVDRVRPGVGERAGRLLEQPGPSSFDAVITALINAAAEWPGDEALLVLDDYHWVDAEQVHGPVGFLVDHLPPGLRLVLASRSEPPLPLARLRAGGQLAELRAAELRFTAGEARSLLADTVGADLDAAVVAALTARAEGWAAGLQLAGLSMRGQADPAGLVASFSGSNRHVLDYLTAEVLDRQDEQMRAFLLETSVLDRLSGPLCDAVTGRAGGQATLERAERASLFLVPLDEVREWWRYHHLFADLLRARLQAERPGQLAALHWAAGTWCEGHGFADDAVHHALAAGDATWAARLIEEHFDEYRARGEIATTQRWLEALPAGLVRSRPRLCVIQACNTILAGDEAAAEIALDAAESALTDTADDPFRPSVGIAASMLANVRAAIAVERSFLAGQHGDVEGAAGYAAQARASLGGRETMLQALTALHLAAADWLGGRLAAAERALLPLTAAGQGPGQLAYTLLRAFFLLGQVQRGQGKLDAADHTYRRALEFGGLPALPGSLALSCAGIGHEGLAELAYERNELDTALRHVSDGIAEVRQCSYTAALAAGLATLAWIRQAAGDQVGALDAMGEAERVARGSPADMVVSAQRASLLLAQGDVAGAARWAEERGLQPGDEPAFRKEREQLTLARILLAQDQPGAALTLLDRLYAVAEEQHRTGSVIEIRAVQALALAASGQPDHAVDALAGALSLACPQGYLRVFADEGAPMAALLRRLAAAQRAGRSAPGDVPPGYLARILRALGQTRAVPEPSARAAGAVPGLAEPLTSRELQVLTLLAVGATNRTIATELVVSLDTVKKHVSHVLDKIGAANRTEAVARARQLGLIS
jgi:LuxR family transcriptional regulator, maltose regulon positive regulatory protein